MTPGVRAMQTYTAARTAERKREAAQFLADHAPAPPVEHSSREPWPATLTPPRTVTGLSSLAVTHGWTVELAYARGPRPGPRGKGWVMTETISVRVRQRTTYRWGYCVYVRAGSKWSFESALLGGGPCGLFAYANYTDFREWLVLSGSVPSQWYTHILDRIKAQKARARQSTGTRKIRESGG